MKVTPFDRGSFLVDSESEPEAAYVVDLEEGFCTCDDWCDESRWKEGEPHECKHFDAVRRFLAPARAHKRCDPLALSFSRK